MEKEVEIKIAGMIYNQSLGGTYSLVLIEHENQRRRFSVLIGESEAQSIALYLNDTKAPRPLSHDLMNSIVRELHAKMTKMVIYKMSNDIFYSEIHLLQGNNPIIIDSRTSDAIALAVRSNAPIFIKEEILTIVGADSTEELKQSKLQSDKKTEELDITSFTEESVKTLSKEQLQENLDKAIAVELYEIAAIIRDEMESRED